MTPEQRQLLIRALVMGDLAQAESLHKIISGRKVVLSSLMDCLKFFYAVDKEGNPLDRAYQIASGELEVEFADPVRSFLSELEGPDHSTDLI